jgi:Predicted ATPase (AAA+ superfamily)
MNKRENTRLQNPFVYTGYVSPDYFCDRKEETEDLISNLRNGRNTTLIAPRRIGKTGLIKNTFYWLERKDKDAVCIYLDIFSTKNQHDFVRMLGSAVINRIMSLDQTALKRIMEFFGSWRPVFGTDPMTGMPTVSVSIEPTESDLSLGTIFDYLKQSPHQIYIAIDEFQQITNYPESGTEALLRSHIQFAPNVHFIFSGSKRHIMAQIFNSPARPFYQSTASMGLYPLHEEIYYDFARSFFEKANGCLGNDVFHYIYQRFDGVTWNIQQILNRLYETDKRVEDESQANEAIRHIVSRNGMLYEGLIEFLTDNQLLLLKAIAKSGCVESPQSNSFIRQFGLPSPSSIKTALTVLIDKELVYRDSKGYMVYDRFFELWLKQLP